MYIGIIKYENLEDSAYVLENRDDILDFCSKFHDRKLEFYKLGEKLDVSIEIKMDGDPL